MPEQEAEIGPVNKTVAIQVGGAIRRGAGPPEREEHAEIRASDGAVATQIARTEAQVVLSEIDERAVDLIVRVVAHSDSAECDRG